jgi:hydroxyacyl-ACP dehydratase HTD2-like protein with hotdog domain
MLPDQLIRSIVLKPVTMTQLAFYCAAAGVTDPIHYDSSFARQTGFPDVVVNGSLRVTWMAQALHELVSPEGWLTQLACSHRGLMLVGEQPRLAIRYRGHTPSGAGIHVELAVQTLVGERLCDSGEGVVYVARYNETSAPC